MSGEGGVSETFAQGLSQNHAIDLKSIFLPKRHLCSYRGSGMPGPDREGSGYCGAFQVPDAPEVCAGQGSVCLIPVIANAGFHQ